MTELQLIARLRDLQLARHRRMALHARRTPPHLLRRRPAPVRRATDISVSAVAARVDSVAEASAAVALGLPPSAAAFADIVLSGSRLPSVVQDFARNPVTAQLKLGAQAVLAVVNALDPPFDYSPGRAVLGGDLSSGGIPAYVDFEQRSLTELQ